MKLAAEWAIDVLIMVGATLYTATALCCVWAMWSMRKKFFMSLRSPLLGCMIGTSYTLRSCIGTYVVLLELHGWTADGRIARTGMWASEELILAPATLVSTGAMIAWVLRLLVMYDPKKRKKYGRHINERRVFSTLVCTFVVLELGVWSAVGARGLEWAVSYMTFLDATSMLTTLAAVAVLSSQLRHIHDVCSISSDIQGIGALVVGTIVFSIAAVVAPMPPLAYKYTLAATCTIAPQAIVWIINIKPVLSYLRYDESVNGERGSLSLLSLPWIWLWRRIADNGSRHGRVACTTSGASKPGVASSGVGGLGGTQSKSTCFHETPLSDVMDFLPLREAFGKYCQKALCSESFQFLVDVSHFLKLVYATGRNDETSGKDDFEEFNVIVDEYIKDNSNSEINIDCSTKKKLMGFCDRSAYALLGQEGRANVFLPAEKEISKMLTENLLDKFKTTAEYRELVGDI